MICKLLVKLGIPGVSATTLTFTMVTLEDTRVDETPAAPTYPISAAKASLAVISAVHRVAAIKLPSATYLIIGCGELFEYIATFMLRISASQSADANCKPCVSEQASQTDLRRRRRGI